ncbi:hypothetical protein Z043_108777 [Scleropages formosus]|uniref:Uncharacterized protein n=1 Tax=Scleropages formosus TaxID=113540 RepID=A0A0P7US75_SCLFO|nr:hypothetical protein Z043_108777 [Scleropages formosus]
MPIPIGCCWESDGGALGVTMWGPLSDRLTPTPTSLARTVCQRGVHGFNEDYFPFMNRLASGGKHWIFAKELRSTLEQQLLFWNSNLQPYKRKQVLCIPSRDCHCQHWLPSAARIKVKTLVMVYKSINGIAPSYLQDLIIHYTPTKLLHFSTSACFVIPHTKGPKAKHKASALTFLTSHFFVQAGAWLTPPGDALGRTEAPPRCKP